MRGSAEVHDALSSLRSLARTTGASGIRQELRLGSDNAPRVMPAIELLPAHFVLSLLQDLKTRPSALFLAYAFRDHKQLEKYCQKVYFPTEPVSIAVLTLVNGMLLYNIRDLHYTGNHGPCENYDLEPLRAQADRNFQLGVETYEMFAHPSLESAKVLMLAVGSHLVSCGKHC